ncbi:RHS repeat-associated core domain-containing protein [Pseudomonas sp. RIT-PI-q]|uniref:RHS repeat-associated core domain-containing protein n=1 Tax=Pseudomonas sp. RIT-PI-q TaxID=1690247 RepID=UPI00075176BF|nr:RHS repeat-associated core domain-containing protein [Pseudomonas sp. RIT-PI-q]
MPRSQVDDRHDLRQSRTVLLATDKQSSVIAKLAGDKPGAIAYTAYGQQSAQQQVVVGLGFNGELCEARLGWYLLGNGYRAYNPTLMRFHSPDSLSPFGKGGLNAYMYCAGDPVNFSDPTGHMLKSLVSALKIKPNKGLTSSPSTSSLSPLIPNAAKAIPSKTAYKTIQAQTKEVQKYEVKDIGPWKRTETPPPIPPKKQLPRFNDTGGQVSIASTASDQPPIEIWHSRPFVFPEPPLPASRELPGGPTRFYSFRNGNLSSVEKISMSDIQKKIEAARKN